jgi:protein-arginine kinase activator protein McsA
MTPELKKRIDNLEREVEIALDEEDFDTAAFFKLRILHVLSEEPNED